MSSKTRPTNVFFSASSSPLFVPSDMIRVEEPQGSWYSFYSKIMVARNFFVRESLFCLFVLNLHSRNPNGRWELEDQHLMRAWYEEWMAPRGHVHFLGSEGDNHPVIVSIERPPIPSKPARCLLRTFSTSPNYLPDMCFFFCFLLLSPLPRQARGRATRDC
jgi:hypothetical protein